MAHKLTEPQYRAIMTAQRKTGEIHKGVRPNTVASLVRLGLATADRKLTRDGIALADRWHAPADREAARAQHREMVERGSEALRQDDGAAVVSWRIQSTVLSTWQGSYSLAEGRPVDMVQSDRMVTLSPHVAAAVDAAASVGGALRLDARAERSEGGRSVRMVWPNGSHWVMTALGADGEPLRPVAIIDGPAAGMMACGCCGVDIIGVPGDRCEGCQDGDGEGAGEGCDYATTWHCFTGHCDGSGCSYPGECEGAPVPVSHGA